MNFGKTEQDIAYDKLIEFIHGKEKSIVLQGQAGTGKTYLLKQVVEYLKTTDIEYILCAPTHRSKFVLSAATDESTVTLHKLLDLSPNIEIFKLDYKNLIFKSGTKKESFPYHGIIIIDESSMITDALYELLMKRCDEVHTRVIFVGDEAQIQGVNEGHISKVFNLPNKITLTHIYRQHEDNSLIPLFTNLRTDICYKFNEIHSPTGTLKIYDKAIDMAVDCAEMFRKAIYKEDVNYTKMIAYTNNRVLGYNTCLRKLLWKDNDEYHLGEFITGYENFNYMNSNQFYNSIDYIIIDAPRLTTRLLPRFGKVDGYVLSIYDTIYKSPLSLFILSRNIDPEITQGLASELESIRFEALNVSKYNAKVLWRDYFSLQNSFAVPFDIIFDGRVVKKKTIDYGYAMTVHKVQGSSIDSIFIDMRNILNTCRNPEELRQLQYVALSRTKSNIYLFQ